MSYFIKIIILTIEPSSVGYTRMGGLPALRNDSVDRIDGLPTVKVVAGRGEQFASEPG